MHGIAFDKVLLVHPDAMRTAEPGEVAPDGAKCPYCDQPITKAAVTAQWGGALFAFDSIEHFRKVENEIERRETVIGPKEGYPCGTPLDKIVAALKERELKAEGDFTEDRRDKPFGDK